MAKSKFKIKVKNSNGTVSVRGDITADSQEEADKVAEKLSNDTGFPHFAEFVEELEGDEEELELEEDAVVSDVEDEVVDEEDEDEDEDEDEGEDSPDVSTKMRAEDAIDHIENNSVEDLEGFVPDEEDRVTVLRAWESKQDEG